MIEIRKPRIRAASFYLLTFSVLVLNVANGASSGNYPGSFPVYAMIWEVFLANLLYIVLRVVVPSFVVVTHKLSGVVQ